MNLPHEVWLRVFCYLEHNTLLCIRLVSKTWAALAASCIRVMHGRGDLFCEELSEVFGKLESLSLSHDAHVNERVLASLGSRAARIKRLTLVGQHTAAFVSQLTRLCCLKIVDNASSLLPSVNAPLVQLAVPPDADLFLVIAEKFGSALERLELLGNVSHVMAELPGLLAQLPKLSHLTVTGWYWTLELEKAICGLKILRDPCGEAICRFAPQLVETCPDMYDLELSVSRDSLSLVERFGPRFSVLHVSKRISFQLLERHLKACPNVEELFIQEGLMSCDSLCVLPHVRTLRFGVVQPEEILRMARYFPRTTRVISLVGKWKMEDLARLSDQLPLLEHLALCMVEIDVICAVLADRTFFPNLMRFRMILDSGVYDVRKAARQHRPWLVLRFDA